MGLLDQWNKNKFSIYKNEEKTVLKLIEALANWMETSIKKIDEVDILSNDNKNKKVSYDDLHNKYKLSPNADFTGSWFGLTRPTLSEEGMRATVEKLQNDYDVLSTDILKRKEGYEICKSEIDIRKALATTSNIYIPKGVIINLNGYIEITREMSIINEGTINQTKANCSIFVIKSNRVNITGGIYNGVDANDTNLPYSYGSAIVIDRVNECVISSCKIYGCSKKYGVIGSGIYITGGKNNIVEKCYIEGCHIGVNNDAAFTGSVSENNIIRNNYIKSCKYGYILDLQGNDYDKHIGDIVENNYIIDSLKNGIQVDDTNKYFTIKNNIVLNSVENGIVVMNRTSFGLIENNYIISSGQSGIILNHINIGHLISNITIRNNVIRYSKTDGISLYNTHRIVIDTNQIMNSKGCGIVNFPGAYPVKIKITDNNISWNEGPGIKLVDVRWCDIISNDIFKNGVETPNVHSGIVIDRANGTPTMICISYNKFLDDGEETQKYGIENKSNIINFIVASYNHIENQKTSAVFDATSTGMKLHLNKGVADN